MGVINSMSSDQIKSFVDLDPGPAQEVGRTDAADARTVNPTYMPDAMARTLRLHRQAQAWDTSYSHAISILASAGFTAAEVIEYASEAVNIAKGAAA